MRMEGVENIVLTKESKTRDVWDRDRVPLRRSLLPSPSRLHIGRISGGEPLGRERLAKNSLPLRVLARVSHFPSLGVCCGTSA